MMTTPEDAQLDAMAYLRANLTGDRAGMEVILTHCDGRLVVERLSSLAIDRLRDIAGDGSPVALIDRWRDLWLAPVDPAGGTG